MKDEVGKVYLLHFHRPFSHAKHYRGFAKNDQTLKARIRHHRNGTSGAKIMTALYRAGIGFDVVEVRTGTRSDERSLKGRGASRSCPACNPKEDLDAMLASMS